MRFCNSTSDSNVVLYSQISAKYYGSLRNSDSFSFKLCGHNSQARVQRGVRGSGPPIAPTLRFLRVLFRVFDPKYPPHLKNHIWDTAPPPLLKILDTRLNTSPACDRRPCYVLHVYGVFTEIISIVWRWFSYKLTGMVLCHDTYHIKFIYNLWYRSVN